ncbi:MAG: flavin reductase family protein [candidate division Zixibacteria bacterium]|nr:flavin reductase family protein [candidate division Zixibacteria bacterium]
MKKSFGAKTLIYPVPVWVICTYDSDGKPNGMTAAWAGVACSKPPAIGVSLRKATYSYQCIVDRKAFCVCVPSENQVKEADYFGIASGRDTNKFDDTGLTPVKSELVDAPYIKEFPMILECKLIHSYEIGLHTQFIGEILDVKIDEDKLNTDGQPDMSKIMPIVYAPGLQTYHRIGSEIGRGYKSGKSVK